jgi:hypothetical protein
MTSTSRRTIALVALFLLFASATACDGRRATREDCRQILDRLVDLELQERGFRDPALAARWRAQADAAHAAELAACEGQRIPRTALACVQAATNSEEISHRCFR